MENLKVKSRELMFKMDHRCAQFVTWYQSRALNLVMSIES